MLNTVEQTLHSRDHGRGVVDYPRLIERYVNVEFSIHLHFAWGLEECRDGVRQDQTAEKCLRFQPLDLNGAFSDDAGGVGGSSNLAVRVSGDDTRQADVGGYYVERSVLVSVVEVTDEGEFFTPGVASVVRLQQVKLPFNGVSCSRAQEWTRGQSGLSVCRRLLPQDGKSGPARAVNRCLPGGAYQDASEVVQAGPEVVQKVPQDEGNNLGYWAHFTDDDVEAALQPIASFRVGHSRPGGEDILQCRLILDDWNVWPVLRIREDLRVERVKVLRGPVEA